MKKIFAAIVALGFLVVGPAVVTASVGSGDIEARVLRILTKYLPLLDNAGPYGNRAFMEHFRKDDPQYDLVLDEGAAGKGLGLIQLDGTVSDTATGVFNLAYLGEHTLAYAALGAGQTLNLDMAAEGLDFTGDAADDEGYELLGGILGASGRPFVIGRDPAFYFCATFELADVSDTDDFHVGFRSVETINAAYNDYTEYASIGTIGEVDPATIYVETDNVSVADASTDTTDTFADGSERVWCTLVSGAGAVTYTNNGAAPTTTAAFSFTDGEAVIPHIWSLHGTTSSMGAVLKRWTVKYTN